MPDNKTWPLFCRQPSKLSFPTKRNSTAVFALLQWNLGRESCSENVYTGSAGQRLQLLVNQLSLIPGRLEKTDFLNRDEKNSDEFVMRDWTMS